MRVRWATRLAICALTLGFAACGDSGDAGSGDETGSSETGSSETGSSETASGDPDAMGSGTDSPDAAADHPDAGPGQTDTGPGDPDAGSGDEADTPPEVDPEPACGTGDRVLPEGLVELAWDDGTAEGWLIDYDVNWNIDGAPLVLSENAVTEAVRFELLHPARIHGFSVVWANLPPEADPNQKLLAGLNADFGHNGRDHFFEDPLWKGTRCVGDAASGEWVDYVFPTPIELPPGLVFAGQRRNDIASPALAIDASDTPPEWWVVDPFEGHSAIGLPNVGNYHHEFSVDTKLDFMVRLHVEWLEEIEPEARLFQPDAQTTGSRAAWGDYDSDGWDDLLANGTLLHNEGDGTFTSVSEAAGLTGQSLSGGVWGDYDNDGCLDLFAFAESTTAGDSLWRNNCDGTFTDVTVAAGIDDVQDYNLCEGAPEQEHAPSPAAAWWDYDADGLLDVVVVGFICWGDWTFYKDQLFHNEGDGTFTEVSTAAGLLDQAFSGRGASPIDHDRDGDVDLLINDYTLHRNLFYDNAGDGTVTERGVELGLAGHQDLVPLQGAYFGHTIGAAWGDLDSDGDFDVVQANLAHPRFFTFSDKTQVLLDDGTGHYVDAAGEWTPGAANGLRYQETHSVPALADFDHDGNLDLIITAIYPGRPTDFYWGHGDGTFALDSYHAGLTITDGWGLAASDYDHDGDLDLAYKNLWTNEGAAADGTHWLQVRAVGNVASNRAAIGATVAVTAGGVTQLRHVQGGTGQGCQDSQSLHFGLAGADSVESIEVWFVGAAAPTTFSGPWGADQRLWVFEDGTVTAGWAPPE